MLDTIEGDHTFFGLHKLITLDLPKLDKIDGNSTFNDLPALTTLDLPILENNIADAIEFNSGYDNTSKKNYKRNFWDLFK